MKERAINNTSVNRQKTGKREANDFVIKFNPILKLEDIMKHELAMDKVIMTYSWHNISDQFKNNKIKYSSDNGQNWETINFVHGTYSNSDLNSYIH